MRSSPVAGRRVAVEIEPRMGASGLDGERVSVPSHDLAAVVLHQFSDLKMNLRGVYEELAVKDFYGKVTDKIGKDGYRYQLRFTSIPLEVTSYFLGHQQHAKKQPEEHISS